MNHDINDFMGNLYDFLFIFFQVRLKAFRSLYAKEELNGMLLFSQGLLMKTV